MEARAQNVSDILHPAAQYIVPLFQRSYSWHKEHWQRLNDDIFALADEPDREVHFLGPLVCTLGKNVPGALPTFQLIDGQQRLTTLTVILAGIRDVARDRGVADLAEEITEDYLIHKRKQDTERFKVLPRIGDREALRAIIESQSMGPFSQMRLVHAWRYFRRRILHRARRDPKTELQNLFDTVTRRLSLVVITIDGENPYEIFESLNATGLPLAESDLIRNYVFMQIPISDQEAFDRTHWRSLEQYFAAWGDERASVMSSFYRDYLMREGRYSRENNTFIDFKKQQRERGLNAVQQAEELRRFAPLAAQIRDPETCPSKFIRQRLADIASMDIGTAYALVLNLLDRHGCANLSEEEIVTCLGDLVSFVLRRTICGETTRPYSRWFVEAIGVLGTAPAENLKRYWLQRGWPDDKVCLQALREFQFYKREPRKVCMVLEALECDKRHKEQVMLGNLSIEHVMPQSISDTAAGRAWQQALGEKWEDVHEQYLHVLGNLTLTGYNPKLGKMAFSDKQSVYSDSHVDLNRYFNDLPVWNAEFIEKRTDDLSEALCRHWPRPPTDKPYILDLEELSEHREGSPARRRNHEYWRTFLRQWDKKLDLPSPLPSDTPELIVPLDKGMGVSVIMWQFRRDRKLVAYVRFEGRAGRRLYAQLHEKAKEIDDQIEGELIWDWPVRNSFAVCEEDVDFADRNDWDIQHAWFSEELSDIVAALMPELAQADREEDEDAGSGEDEVKERHRLRQMFWTELLRYAETKTSLHANRRPNIYNWIGGGIGRRGFSLNYSVREYESQVELYIDLGKGCEKENKNAFMALRRNKDAVDAVFGALLEWQELPEKRACRICKVFKGGWRSPSETWAEAHMALVDAMIRLDKALRPHVQGLP